MSRVDRTERLLNLLFCLMASRIPVRRSAIESAIPGYSDAASPAAFERMFERDKDELRSMGIPIETVLDANGDVDGYVIRRDAYALPEIELTAAERSAVALAADAWSEAVLHGNAATAARKLEAVGVDEVPAARPAGRVTAGNAAVLPILQALRSRTCVCFGYRRPDQEASASRHVDPWGLLVKDGAWYLVGHDRQRGAERVFRLSRIDGEVRAADAVVTEMPAGTDLRALVERAPHHDPIVNARVRIDSHRGAELRRVAGIAPELDEADVVGLDEGTLVSLALAAGSGATVLSPASVRERVIGDLRAVLAAHGGVH